MRALPPQTLHLPFQPGPYRMAMDLVTVPERDWFEFDDQYTAELAEKRVLLTERHADVFAALLISDDARAETLMLVAASLAEHHPDWFSRRGDRLRNHLTDETVSLAAADTDPLERASMLVQEDLCVIQDSADGPLLTAASLCFPSRWRLADKIGKPLAQVHGPVPFYAERLARPVDRFMRHLKPGHIAVRLNWSVPDDPALFQPGGKWRRDGRPDITAANVAQHVFLRVERQTLRRLPATGAVLFGIRVHVYPLTRLLDRAGDLAAAVRALPPETLHYKSVLPFRTVLLAWLDAHRISHSGQPPG